MIVAPGDDQPQRVPAHVTIGGVWPPGFVVAHTLGIGKDVVVPVLLGIVRREEHFDFIVLPHIAFVRLLRRGSDLTELIFSAVERQVQRGVVPADPHCRLLVGELPGAGQHKRR